MKMNEFSIDVRVYIEDTDAGGIVYYANYLKFLERARTEFMRFLGINKPALMQDAQLVVVELNLRYLSPALLDDSLKVTVNLKELKRASFWIEQRVFRDNDILIDGKVRLAALQNKSKKLIALPKKVKSCLEKIEIIKE